VAFQRLPWDPDTWYTDVHMFRQPEFGAIYLIDEEKTAIVETGTSNDVTAILAALKEFGRDPKEVDALIVSHIHLDHAGGAGFLLESMPNATVYVHERGAKHLADPSRLLASAAQALQDQAAAFGTMRPVPRDRLVAVKEGDTLDLGGRILTFHDSPGHAPHELTVSDSKNRCVYTGDACGLWFPRDRLLMPITPAPSFDLQQNLAVFQALMRKRPRALLFSHYGPHEDPPAALEQQLVQYSLWAAFVHARRKGASADQIIEELYNTHCKGATFYPEKFLKERIQTSVHGLLAYHQRLEDAAPRG
jgi:glyoxylase-like metal-dependent hydrolase (beta-lactamase superfamily II)